MIVMTFPQLLLFVAFAGMSFVASNAVLKSLVNTYGGPVGALLWGFTLVTGWVVLTLANGGGLS